MLEVRLRDYTDTLKGYAFKSNTYQDSGTPVVRVSDFTQDSISSESLVYIDNDLYDNYKKYALVKNDILIQTVGSWQNNPASVVGKVVRVPLDLNNSLLNQNAVKIIPKNIDYDFLFYLLKSDYFKYYILSTAQGAANQASITLESIGKFKFNLLSKNIQKKIANILSNYDNLIENNNKRIKLLEDMAEEIYKEWFVRLRFPKYKDTKIVNSIPNGWDYSKLNKYLEFFRGKSYSSKDIESDEGLPFVNLKCINRNGGFRKNGIKVFSGQYKEDNVAYSGDIMMAVTDMTQDRAIVGRVGRIPKMEHDKFIFSMDLIRIEPIDIDKTFLYSLLRFSNIGLYLKEFANGANVLHLTPDVIYKVDALIPNEDIQKKFSELVNPVLEEIDTLEQKNQNLKQTRDLLLPRLISGKLDIGDLDIKG